MTDSKPPAAQPLSPWQTEQQRVAAANAARLAAAVAAQRAALRTSPAPIPGAAPPDLAALQAAASARCATAAPRIPLPIASSIARVAGARVQNVKIHAADLRRIRARPDAAAFLSRVRSEVAQRRAPGDPKGHTLAAVAQSLAALASRGAGYARVTFRGLATAARLSPETCRLAVRWLQRDGLVDVVNVLARRVIGGVRRLVRDANMYLLQVHVRAPASPASPASITAHPPVAPGWRTAAIDVVAVVGRWRGVFGDALALPPALRGGP